MKVLRKVPENEPVVRDLIYTVRGTQVMLGSDPAMLYGVETRALNQAVTRNPGPSPNPSMAPSPPTRLGWVSETCRTCRSIW